MKDLFEHYEEMPSHLTAICDKWTEKHLDEGLSYIDCADFLKELEAIGYTFEYGLDAEPYGLVEISKKKVFVYLAKLGVVVSTDENGETEVQRIDSPEEFRDDNELFLDFTPPLLESDQEAKDIYNSITHSMWIHLTGDKT